MKPISNCAYCGVVAPDRMTLCIPSLPLAEAHAPYSILKPVKKRASFPVLWGVILGCLMVCNSAQADDVRLKLRDYYLQQLAESDNQTLDEDRVDSGVGFRVKGEANQFEIGYTSQSNWQVGFEQLVLGGQNALFTEVVSLDSDLQESFTQAVEQYSGWGAKLGYRYVLEGNLSYSIHVGGFNWEQVSFNSSEEQKQAGIGETGISPYVGIGVEYRLSEQASWSLNWQHVELRDDSFDDLAVTLAYRF